MNNTCGYTCRSVHLALANISFQPGTFRQFLKMSEPREEEQQRSLSCIGVAGLSVDNKRFLGIIQVILNGRMRRRLIPVVTRRFEIEPSKLRQKLDNSAGFATAYVVNIKEFG